MLKIAKILITLLALVTIGIYIYSLPQLKAKILPAKKEVEGVKTHIPSVQIADSDLEIAENGIIVKGQNNTLPQLYLPGELKVSDGQITDDKNVIFAAKIASLISKTDFLPSSIRVLAKGDVAVYQTDQTVAIFTTEKSPDEQIDSLQQVLAAAKIEGTKLAKIDLRYNKPTITFK